MTPTYLHTAGLYIYRASHAIVCQLQPLTMLTVDKAQTTCSAVVVYMCEVCAVRSCTHLASVMCMTCTMHERCVCVCVCGGGGAKSWAKTHWCTGSDVRPVPLNLAPFAASPRAHKRSIPPLPCSRTCTPPPLPGTHSHHADGDGRPASPIYTGTRWVLHVHMKSMNVSMTAYNQELQSSMPTCKSVHCDMANPECMHATCMPSSSGLHHGRLPQGGAT